MSEVYENLESGSPEETARALEHTKGSQISLVKRSFWSELRVIWVVAIKGLKISARYRVNFILGTLFPISIFLMFVRLILEARTFGPTEGLQTYLGIRDFASFALISEITSWHYLVIIEGGRKTMREEQITGTLEATFTCPVKRQTLLAGYSLSNFIAFLPSIMSMFVLAYLMGLRFYTNPLNILLAFLAFFLGLGGCFGLGVILAGFVIKYREPGIIDQVLFLGLSYIMGYTYPVTVLPMIPRVIAYLIPLTYALDSVRSLLVGSKPLFPIAHQLVIMTVFIVLAPLIGLLIFNKLEKNVMRKEGVGAY